MGERVAQDRRRPEERTDEQEEGGLERSHDAPASAVAREVSRRSRSCMSPIIAGGA